MVWCLSHTHTHTFCTLGNTVLLIFQQLLHTKLDVFQPSQLYPVKEFVPSQRVTDWIKNFSPTPCLFHHHQSACSTAQWLFLLNQSEHSTTSHPFPIQPIKAQHYIQPISTQPIRSQCHSPPFQFSHSGLQIPPLQPNQSSCRTAFCPFQLYQPDSIAISHPAPHPSAQSTVLHPTSFHPC